MEVILASAFGRNKDVQNTQNDRLIQAAIGSFEAFGQTKPDSAVSKLVCKFPTCCMIYVCTYVGIH